MDFWTHCSPPMSLCLCLQVRLADGVRVGGSRLEGELVDLSGRPASLGVCTHEDLICVLAVRPVRSCCRLSVVIWLCWDNQEMGWG